MSTSRAKIADEPPTSSRGFLRRLWLFAWIAITVFIVVDSAGRLLHNQYINEVAPVLAQPAGVDEKSPTGYVEGQRSRILPRFAIDGYHWIMQTQQMFETGELRIRHVNYDNAPEGREVHWASPFRWWLGALAWLDHEFMGLPIGQSVERASLYANPLLLILFLSGLVLSVVRHIGSAATAWLAVGLGTAISFYGYFVAADPDHHGLVGGCVVVSLLAMLIALLEVRDGQSGRTSIVKRWLIISAVSGGFGLWVSSATMAPLLVGVGLGAVVGGVAAARDADFLKNVSWVWGYWGRWGCACSIVFWLMEYFPSELSMRLEVNHPLYGLAWLGGGEFIRLWLSRRNYSTDGGRWLGQLLLSLGGVLSLPVVVMLGGFSVFKISDPFLWRLHHEYINEFESVVRFYNENGVNTLLWSTLLLLALWVFTVTELWRKEITAKWRLVFSVGLGATLVFTAMGIVQVRWLGLAAALCVVFSSVWISAAAELRPSKTSMLIVKILAVSAVVPALFLSWNIFSNRHGVTTQELKQLTDREIAAWIHRRSGAKTPVIVSSPGLSTVYAYHAGAKTIGTLYWENIDGLRTTADFFGAKDAETAYSIAKKTGITHLLFASWSDFVSPYVKLSRGLKTTDEVPENAFAADLLLKQTPPAWLRPVACNLPDNPAFAVENVILYEVVPPRSIEQALVDFVNFLVDSEQLPQAIKFAGVLKSYPDFVPAKIALTRLQLLQQDEPGFVSSMRSILATSLIYGQLSLGDRIQLALQLAVLGDDQKAAWQFKECWAQAELDQAAFRQLSGNTIVYLLQQSQRLGLAEPPKLRALARSLISPTWLQQLDQAAPR